MAPRGYPVAVVKRARELYEAGWTNCSELARILARETGQAPNPTTIRKWVDPDYAEVCRARRQIGGISGPNREKTWQLRLRRVRELRGIGLSFRDIAALISHDFDVSLSTEQVAYMLTAEPRQSTLERLLWPQQEAA